MNIDPDKYPYRCCIEMDRFADRVESFVHVYQFDWAAEIERLNCRIAELEGQVVELRVQNQLLKEGHDATENMEKQTGTLVR